MCGVRIGVCAWLCVHVVVVRRGVGRCKRRGVKQAEVCEERERGWGV